MASPKALLRAPREKRPALDHLIRAFGRYSADAGDRQAAAVTFFGFLSFFPILALATSVLSYALGDDAVGTVVDAGQRLRPGAGRPARAARTILSSNRAAGLAGLVGLLGLLYSGLGWVDALREAVRAIWHHNVQEGNFVVKKLKDVVVLLGLGATLLVSIGVSAATGALSGLRARAGRPRRQRRRDGRDLRRSASCWACSPARGSSCSCSGGCPRCSRRSGGCSRARCWPAVLFEVLKRVGALYIERTTENPLYGSFAVIVGLLVWINIVSRMLLICAAWTVTAPYDSDIEPSGTANAEAAAKAGIPMEFADNDPDDPPTLQEDGAPSPLAAAVQGQTPSQDVPEGRGSARSDGPDDRGGRRVEALKDDEDEDGRARSGSGSASRAASGARSGGGTATLARPAVASGTAVATVEEPTRAEVAVRQAAQFTAGALGMGVMAVLIYVLRTVRRHRPAVGPGPGRRAAAGCGGGPRAAGAACGRRRATVRVPRAPGGGLAVGRRPPVPVGRGRRPAQRPPGRARRAVTGGRCPAARRSGAALALAAPPASALEVVLGRGAEPRRALRRSGLLRSRGVLRRRDERHRRARRRSRRSPSRAA